MIHTKNFRTLRIGRNYKFHLIRFKFFFSEHIHRYIYRIVLHSILPCLCIRLFNLLQLHPIRVTHDLQPHRPYKLPNSHRPVVRDHGRHFNSPSGTLSDPIGCQFHCSAKGWVWLEMAHWNNVGTDLHLCNFGHIYSRYSRNFRICRSQFLEYAFIYLAGAVLFEINGRHRKNSYR